MWARVRQFREAGIGPDLADLQLAKDHLSGPLLALFQAQEPRDIRHSARTAHWLMERGETDPELIQAALLHDIGKGDQRRVDRVVYVVAGWAKIVRLIASQKSRFTLRRAVARSLHHAHQGAAMLQAGGASDRVVELTSLHHVSIPRDAMLTRLSEADAAS